MPGLTAYISDDFVFLYPFGLIPSMEFFFFFKGGIGFWEENVAMFIFFKVFGLANFWRVTFSESQKHPCRYVQRALKDVAAMSLQTKIADICTER